MTTASVGASRRPSTRSQIRPQVILAAVLVVGALLLGGGTRPGLLSDTVIAWVAGVALVASLPGFFVDPGLSAGRPYAVVATALLPDNTNREISET